MAEVEPTTETHQPAARGRFVRRRRGPPTPIPIVVALLAAFAGAAIFRMARPDLVSFTADEGIHGIGAMEIAVFESFPMVGLPSVGIRNSALFLYALAVPYFIWFNPVSGVVFVALLNLLGMAMVWRIGRRVVGEWPTVCALGLIAVSPWSVIYARNMWPPSCVLVPCLMLIDSALVWLDRGGRGRLIWTIILAFVCPQMHFSGFCGPVWLLAVLYVGRKQVQLDAALLGTVLGLATWGPWIYWQHYINQWADIAQLLRNAKGTVSLGETVSAACAWWCRLLGSSGFDYWFGIGPGELPDNFAPWVVTANQLASMGIVPLALTATLWGLLQRRNDVRLLAFWCLLPIPMLALLRPAMHPHYVWVAFPIPFLLLAAGGARLVQRMENRNTRAGLVGFALATLLGLGISQTAFLAGWHQFLADDRPTGAGHFQLSLRQRDITARSVLQDWKITNANGIAGLFSGEQPAYGCVFHYMLVSQRLARRSTDESATYWIDEETFSEIGPAALATLRNWRHFKDPVVVKEWRVGPSRIFLVRDGVRSGPAAAETNAPNPVK